MVGLEYYKAVEGTTRMEGPNYEILLGGAKGETQFLTQI